MPHGDLPPDKAARIRAYLLSKSPNASVTRELWSCGPSSSVSCSGTYSGYRQCIQLRRQRHQRHQQQGAAPRLLLAALGGDTLTAAPGTGSGGPLPAAAANPQSLPATVKYSFEGVKHVLAEAASPVTALSFAALRNDLLSYGCEDGELWRVILPLPAAPGHEQPRCTRARKMHDGAVTAVDWSYDNSQLLSAGRDGSLCVWDPAAADLTCLRRLTAPACGFLCARFHRVNFSLAMVGTSSGSLEVFNCSTGILHSQYLVAASGVHVTALDCSPHHVFAGDSAGSVHWLVAELRGGQLGRMRAAGRLRLAAGGGAHGQAAAVTSLQYVPFCRTTDTPVLMVALRDGSLCIVRANEARHAADLYLRRGVGPPPAAGAAAIAAAAASRSGSPVPAPLLRLCPAAICPLSVIQDVPLITYGSEDTAVYIVDVTARSFGVVGAAAAAAAAGGSRPITVSVLRAHRAPVTSVAWSYDEALLASADAEGLVVLWRRSRLF